MKTVEQLAEQFADSLERRLCSYWNGLKNGWNCSDYHKATKDELINHFKK